MIVPGIRQYLAEAEVAALRAGDTAHVDSGLGGSFSVEFTGQEGDKFHFQITSPEFRHWGGYQFTFDEVRHQVYQIVAENPYFRELQQRSQ